MPDINTYALSIQLNFESNADVVLDDVSVRLDRINEQIQQIGNVYDTALGGAAAGVAEATDQIQTLAQHLGDLVRQHRLQHGHVRSEAAGELSARTLGVEARRQGQQVTEELHAQPGYDALARGAQEVDLPEVEGALNEEEAQQGQRDRVDVVEIARDERGVHQVADDERKGEADRGAGNEAGAGADQGANVGSETGSQLADGEERVAPDGPLRSLRAALGWY